jgi:thiol-disulfide isomerase/thioredoxin
MLLTRGVLSVLRWNRRDMLALAAGATLLAGLPARQGSAAGVRPLTASQGGPQPVPDFTFNDAEGAAKTLRDFDGKSFVINFWATWCAPCVAEMPALDRMQRALAEEGVMVLALSSDRGGAAQVRPFYERVGIRHLPIWLDPRGAAARAFGVRAVPTTVLVDRQRREVARLAGPADWDEAPMLAETRRFLRG